MGKKMTKLIFSSLTLTLVASFGSAQLYGIEHGQTNNTIYQINTTTGAASAVFSYAHSSGEINVAGLAYNPTTNKFNTVSYLTPSLTNMIEIDLVGSTATIVSTGIPATFFEGLDYSASLGGMVVSHGPGGNFTNKLSLLDNSYNLLNVQGTTGLADADCLFLDGSGALNVLDTNNLTGNFQRNRINNPFGALSLTGTGANNFVSGKDFDAAWKADEGRLFLTRFDSLATFDNANNITSVGSYGIHADGTLIGITGIAAGRPVPEPASFLGLLGGAGVLLRRRNRK